LSAPLFDFSEPADKARKYFEGQKYPLVNLLDPDPLACQKYGGRDLPGAVLIGKGGIVRQVKAGCRGGEDLSPES
jgi:hypothetical protein